MDQNEVLLAKSDGLIGLDATIKIALLGNKTVFCLWHNCEVRDFHYAYAVVRLTPLLYGKYRAERYITLTRNWRYVNHGNVIDGFARLYAIISESSVVLCGELVDMMNAEWYDMEPHEWQARDALGEKVNLVKHERTVGGER